MGKANRMRRAAKKRHREERVRGRAWMRDHAPSSADILGEVLVAASVVGVGDTEVGAAMVAELASGGEPRRRLVAGTVGELAERYVAALWEQGWQPVDLARVLRRNLPKAAVSFAVAAVGAQSRSYADLGARVAGWWMDQLAEMGAERPEPGPDPWPLGWAAAAGLDWVEAVGAAVQAVALFMDLPPILRIGPPPSEWQAGGPLPGWSGRVSGSRGGADPKVLAKVRALLAKAESTEFEEEAAAFMAKAQELITRHRIDRLLLADADARDAEAVRARRVGVDDPYAGPKALLLDAVADANDCRSVWSKDLGFATVFGDPADLDTVELLFTSLLVQATTALRVAGAASARRRSRAFRQSFLVGYATRIRERLAEGVAAATGAAEAEVGGRFLPVLARHRRQVDDAVREALGPLRHRAVGVNDPAGFFAGKAAAELADLSAASGELAAG
jgi:hypothetical protein